MEKPHALSIGLLISALMRYDHGLFAPYFPNDALSRMMGDPMKKIPRAIDDVIAIYDKLASGIEPETVTERQVSEEFLLKGFYDEGREADYAGALDPFNLTTLAMEKIGRRGAKKEPE